ncbi:unnamed protein product, partial [Laminaria digitata]
YGTCLHFLSRRGFSIPNARRFSSNRVQKYQQAEVRVRTVVSCCVIFFCWSYSSSVVPEGDTSVPGIFFVRVYVRCYLKRVGISIFPCRSRYRAAACFSIRRAL